ncbi:MAG: hypothetical protein AB1847_02020 [bacterium]
MPGRKNYFTDHLSFHPRTKGTKMEVLWSPQGGLVLKECSGVLFKVAPVAQGPHNPHNELTEKAVDFSLGMN